MISHPYRLITYPITIPAFLLLLLLSMALQLGALCNRAAGLDYSDVEPDAWYAPYVAYVAEQGIMTGLGEQEPKPFSPNGTVSRAMVATALYRFATADVGADGFETHFADVEPGKWYTKAIEWCRDRGIVTGYGDGTFFGPHDPVTREQLATMLYRFALGYGKPGAGALESYVDAGDVSSWAIEGMDWCIAQGIITGDTSTEPVRLNPLQPATRAHLAKMLTVLSRDVLGGKDVTKDLAFAQVHVVVEKDHAPTYTGSEQKPAVEVTLGGDTLEQGRDFDVLYANNVAAGTASVVVQGKGSYTGCAETTFLIEPADVANATPILTSSGFVFDGTVHTNKLASLTLNGFELTAGEDYTVLPVSAKDAGTYWVEFEGLGNCCGTGRISFEVEPAAVKNITVTIEQDRMSYTGSEVKPAVVKVAGSGHTLAPDEYTVSYENNVDAGVASVKVCLQGNYTGQGETTFYIYPVSLASAHVTLSQYSYVADGSAKQPSVSVTINGAVVPENMYSVRFTNNVLTGTATVLISGHASYTVGDDANRTPSFQGTGGYCDSVQAYFEILDGTSPYALLYNNGTLVFQLGSIADDALGGEACVAARYTGFADRELRLDEIPWQNELDCVKRVVFLDGVAPVSMAYWFAGCANLVSVDATGLDGGRLTSLCATFAGCTALTSLDMTGLDTSHVTDMSSCFGDWMHGSCVSLAHLDLSNLKTDSVETMAGMFFGCCSLADLVVPTLQSGTLYAVNIEQMFYGCSSLESLDLSGWDTGRVLSAGSLFEGCSSLATVNLSGWDTGMMLYMDRLFYGCESLVYLNLSSWTTKAPTACVYYAKKDLTVSMSQMFACCPSLEQLHLGPDWEWTNETPPLGVLVEGTACAAEQVEPAGETLDLLEEIVTDEGLQGTLEEPEDGEFTAQDDAENLTALFDEELGAPMEDLFAPVDGGPESLTDSFDQQAA